MSYIFDVSSEHNDLLEVDYQILHHLYGDYYDYNRRDNNGHTIYSVIFRDKRYALKFKLMFNTTVVRWDESDDQEIVTKENLLDRGYKPFSITIYSKNSREFEEWCKANDVAVVEEFKFIRNGKEKFNVFAMPDMLELLRSTWP